LKLYSKYFKRLFDFLLSLFALLILSPVLIFVLVILLFSNSGRPFFIQKRPGKDGKIFSIIKFKTMNDHTDDSGNLLPDKDRLTKVGKFIRKTSLDEIPQLINVLIGDMSLIGPRPLLIKYLPYYSELERKRHDVRPGITGWAQVNGRNNLNWNTRLSMDVYYVENLSFLLDMKIIVLTIRNVLKGSDVNIIPGEKMKNLDVERKV
jgi:undecaprenyl phosphate N,N'-diacetylbacillosamine 1-phosphate transferase